MPNVLQLSRTMGQGGAEKVVEQLCRDIKNQHFIVASVGGYRVKTLREHHITHYTIPDIASKNPISMAKTMKALKNIIKKEHIDVIHSHHRMAAFYARLLQHLFPNLKLIYTAHNVYTDKKRLTQFALQNTTIIACGNSVTKNLTNFYEIQQQNITLIQNSVKPERANLNNSFIKSKQTDKLYIGIIGRLVEQKGVDIFLDALPHAPLENMQVYIIGDGDSYQKLKDQTTRLDLNQKVTFLGFRRDIPDLIYAMDVIVSASRWEGLPLTIIECLAAGKTILASDIPSHSEIINHQCNGLLFESGNPHDLAQKLTKLAQHDKLRKKLAKKAKEEYNKYNYSTFIEKYSAIYAKV